MRPLPPRFFPISCLLAAFAGGCAHPTAPGPMIASDQATAEAARREERLKVMQEYWDDHTGAANRGSDPAREGTTPLEYPAGIYAGINFGPRLAPDSSLTEPNR